MKVFQKVVVTCMACGAIAGVLGFLGVIWTDGNFMAVKLTLSGAFFLWASLLAALPAFAIEKDGQEKTR